MHPGLWQPGFPTCTEAQSKDRDKDSKGNRKTRQWNREKKGSSQHEREHGLAPAVNMVKYALQRNTTMVAKAFDFLKLAGETVLVMFVQGKSSGER